MLVSGNGIGNGHGSRFDAAPMGRDNGDLGTALADVDPVVAPFLLEFHQFVGTRIPVSGHNRDAPCHSIPDSNRLSLLTNGRECFQFLT